jgi:hypothetical protein
VKLLESVTSKVVLGVVALGVIVGGITWWQTAPEARSAILTATGRILAWIGIVLVAPLLAALPISHLTRNAISNTPAIALLLTLTACEALLLAWLLDFSISGAAAWIFFLLGILFAAAYNLLICDWLAERIG